MKLVAVAVVVVVLCLLGAWALRRRGGDEMHSVEGYRHALDTLQEVSTRSKSVRVLEPDGGEPVTPPTGTPRVEGVAEPLGGAGVAEADGVVAPGGPGRSGLPVFTEVGRSSGPAHARTAPESPRQSRRAMSAMHHGPRRMGGPLLAAGVVAAAVVVLVVVVGTRDKHGSGTGSSTTTTTTPRSSTTTTARSSTTTGARSSTSTTHPRTTTTVRSSTTTTTPTRARAVYTPVPASVTASSATYVPPGLTYSFSITAGAGPCWTEITEQSTNTVVYGQTLPAGQTETLTLTGTSTVSLGAPTGVTMKLENAPLQLPPGYTSPFTATLQPTTPGG